MKEEKKEIINYKTIFVATDGTEFSNREECTKYEESALGVIRAKVSKLITFDTRNTNEDAWTVLGGLDDHEVVAFKPNTKEDCDVLMQFILLESPYWNNEDMKERREARYNAIIEAWKNNDIVIFGINCDGEFYYINTRQNIISKLNNMDLILDKEVPNE